MKLLFEKEGSPGTTTRITRGEFIVMLASTGIGLFVYGMYGPDKPPPPPPPKGFELYPGSMEERVPVGVSFLSTDVSNGFAEWASKFVFNNPPARDVGKKIVDFFEHYRKAKQVFKKGKFYSLVYGEAEKALGRINADKIHPSTNLYLEQTRLSLIPSALLAAPLLGHEALWKLGVSKKLLPSSRPVEGLYWDEGGWAESFPASYPGKGKDTPGKEPHFSGKDQFEHELAQAMLAVEGLYLRKYQIGDLYSTPIGLQVVTTLPESVGIITPEQSVAITSYITGIGYEVLTTFTEEGILQGFNATRGFTDEMVWADLAANNDGLDLGLKMVELAERRQKPYALFAQMDNKSPSPEAALPSPNLTRRALLGRFLEL